MHEIFKTLFSTFFEICLFRRNPQDIPASNFLLYACLTTLVILGIGISLVSLTLQEALISTGINLAVLVIITQLTLLLFSQSGRVTQTLTAMAGTGIIISIFAIPIVVMMNYARVNEINATPLAMLWLLLVVWEIVVMAHILRQAVGCHFVLGLVIAVTYPWTYFNLVNLAIPSV